MSTCHAKVIYGYGTTRFKNCFHPKAAIRVSTRLTMTALLLIAMLGVSGLARAESSVYVQNNTSFTFSVASEATRGSLSPSYWQQRSRSIQPGARVEVLRFNRDRGITNGRLFELESTLRSGRQSLTLKQRLRGKWKICWQHDVAVSAWTWV